MNQRKFSSRLRRIQELMWPNRRDEATAREKAEYYAWLEELEKLGEPVAPGVYIMSAKYTDRKDHLRVAVPNAYRANVVETALRGHPRVRILSTGRLPGGTWCAWLQVDTAAKTFPAPLTVHYCLADKV